MNEKAYYKELVGRYVSKTASQDELAVFFQLVKEGKLDDFLEDAFCDGEPIAVERESRKAKNASVWRWIAIAASVIVILSAGTLIFLNNKMLTKNADNRVAATVTSSFNHVATSRGSQRQLVLPDGTKIWLNSASSIRYPKTFTGTDRTVELFGECYFEVEHNAALPFHVKLSNGVDIEVIGTHFNVYAYPAEPIKATLIEGRIKVQSNSKSAILQPGQQVFIQEAGKLDINNADIQAALAWKNGILQFNGADVTTVMRQIERWFDVEVVYEGKVPARQLAGKIPGNANINEVLKILELSNVRCKIDGRKITVLQDEMK